METISMSDKLDLIRRVDIFSGLTDSELSVIAENSSFHDYEEGDIIFKEGDYNESLYVIREGEVVITKETDIGSVLELARFIKGEDFGVLDLLERSPNTADARAVTKCQLLVFPEHGMKLQQVLDNYPIISARILHELLAIIAGRIRSTNKLVSEKSQWIEDLRKQLHVDKLTGLYNRVFIEEEFKAKLSEYGDSTGIVFVKPDSFKKINDTYGHEVGDGVIKRLADSFSSFLKEDEIAVRYKANEFLAIFPGYVHDETLSRAREIMGNMKSISIADLTENGIETLTFSLGMAMFPEHGSDGTEVLELGHVKLYESWEAGGGVLKIHGE
jgi:diguanylate cyclase (GGDEF)-like protein